MAEKRTRRRFTREYKAQAVQRVIESGRPLADIAAELDVSPGQLSQWRNEQLAAGSAEALAQKKADEAEMLRLKREVKRLEEENLILRKAPAFLAKGIASADGRWCYLYRAIDRNGNLVDVLSSEHRDRAAAQAFFRSAKAVAVCRDPGPGHDRRPRQLPPRDPHRAGQARAAPMQSVSEQTAGAGLLGHQRPIPADAGLQMPQIGRPVLPGLR